MKKMLREFRDFAMRGNVIDLAVGVIIGGAFGKIVSSLVGDVLMPVLSIFTSRVNVSDLKFVISPAEGAVAENALKYGAFLQSILDFAIIAFCIFLIIKAVNAAKPPPAPAEKPEPPRSEKLLEEIRDLLKQGK